MTETTVTLHGWVGNDVTFRTPKGIPVASFRVGCTPRVKKEGQWQDGETTWYSVTAWRALAEHVRDSVKRGEAVIVHGRLRTHSWVRTEGEAPSTVLQVEASLVGHDLTRGTSVFLKARRPEGADVDLDAEVTDMVTADLGDHPALDSWGNLRVDGEASPVEAGDPARASDPAA